VVLIGQVDQGPRVVQQQLLEAPEREGGRGDGKEGGRREGGREEGGKEGGREGGREGGGTYR